MIRGKTETRQSDTGRSFLVQQKSAPHGATHRICQAYYQDEREIAIVSGMSEGIGKTGYVHHVLAYIYV